jgi:hypothetical protein
VRIGHDALHQIVGLHVAHRAGHHGMDALLAVVTVDAQPFGLGDKPSTERMIASGPMSPSATIFSPSSFSSCGSWPADGWPDRRPAA